MEDGAAKQTNRHTGHRLNVPFTHPWESDPNPWAPCPNPWAPRPNPWASCPKSFYSSSSNRTKSEFSRKLSIKRKLNTACEIVKSKRTQDYILSDKLYKTEPGKGGFLFSDSDPPAIYRVFAKQSEALEFADRSEKPILFYWTWRIYF